MKKLLALTLLLALALPAQAMTTPILSANPVGGTLSTTAVRYIPLGPAGDVGSPGAGAINHTMPTAGTFSKLYVRMGAALVAGTSYEVVLMKNNVATALAVTITDTGLVEQNTTDTVTAAATDLVGYRITPSGTPVSETGNFQVGIVFDSTVSGESLIFSRGITSDTTGNDYFHFGGGSSTSLGTTTYSTVFPTNGVIDKMYVTSGAPGVGNSRDITLMVNGVDSALTCNMAGTAGNCNDVSNTVSISAGDEVVMHEAITGTVTSTTINVAMRFVPTISGESVMLSTGGNHSNAGNRYQNTHGYILNSSSETAVYSVAPIAFTWKKLYVAFATAPGTGNSRAYTARIGGASQSLTASVADTGLTANDPSNTVSVAVGDLIDWITIPVSAPDVPGRTGVGAVMYIAPPAAGASETPVPIRINYGGIWINNGSIIIR
mgnify:CR=1 FL=1